VKADSFCQKRNLKRELNNESKGDQKKGVYNSAGKTAAFISDHRSA
jgi:hypothetical protein